MPAGGSNLIFLVLMVALLVFMVSRTRKQQRAQQQMQSTVAPGAEVMTASGTYGTVVAADGDVITIEIAPGVHTRWARRAVARVVTSGTATGTTPSALPDAGAPGLDLRKDDVRGDAPGTGTR